MIIVTGGAGMIGGNIVKALNEKGINDILVVDNLKNGKKFHNLVDLLPRQTPGLHSAFLVSFNC